MFNTLDPLLVSVLAAYSLILVAAIMLGGKLPTLVRMTHTRTQLVMSFVSGLMLGIAIFHLLPHAIYTIASDQAVDIVARWTMLGLLVMFLLLRVFHFHHHDMSDDAHETQCVEHAGEDHDHTLDTEKSASTKPVSWMGIALGLMIHTMIDGVALAASMQADWSLLSGNQGLTVLVGLGVFLAILLHKPLDALTISSLMSDSGASKTKQRLVMFGFAIICPLSAFAALWGINFISGGNGLYVGAALAFSAGVFLCISLSDLLPEVHFHSHDRFTMTVVLLLGVGLALALVTVEPAHRHSDSNVVIEVKDQSNSYHHHHSQCEH
ncbi:ZIP family metal transporter [bacterium]|nr:ZIP family metal transporter [bacterium]